MAGSKYTFDAWMEGKFVFKGTTIFQTNKKRLKNIETIDSHQVEKSDLSKIKKVQKATFKKLKDEALKKNESSFHQENEEYY
jgi:hypothetical protein